MSSAKPFTNLRTQYVDPVINVLKERPFVTAIVVLGALVTLLFVFPDGSLSRRLFCFIAGNLSVFFVLFATALHAAKKWQLKKAQSFLHDWHNIAGALSLPFALVHASFHGGSILTVSLLVSLSFVWASGFVLADRRAMIVLSGLGKKGSDKAKDAAARLESSRQLALKAHCMGTVVLWVLLILHIVFSFVF